MSIDKSWLSLPTLSARVQLGACYTGRTISGEESRHKLCAYYTSHSSCVSTPQEQNTRMCWHKGCQHITDGNLEYTLVSRNGFLWEPQISSIIYCVNERPEKWHKDISTVPFPSVLEGWKLCLYVYMHVCTCILCPKTQVSLAKSQDMVGLYLHTVPFDAELMEWNAGYEAAGLSSSLCC